MCIRDSRNTSLDSGSVYGVDAEFLKTKGYVIQNGRDFVERDFKEFRKVVLLDDVAVQTLFPGDNPVGKTIELRGEPFTVVGCIRKSDAFEPVINSLEAVSYTHLDVYKRQKFECSESEESCRWQLRQVMSDISFPAA